MSRKLKRNEHKEKCISCGGNVIIKGHSLGSEGDCNQCGKSFKWDVPPKGWDPPFQLIEVK